ncbi:hypothetical protein CH376_16615 [Leptospira adleri]|uniref:Uncharacterized protein n=1 Tax=Leptospira adleri TaxID=2023186 RepID=A0ABX4NVS3_9LEPT|nr:hypothetical protein CH376_16615 [Leptospira adleri]
MHQVLYTLERITLIKILFLYRLFRYFSSLFSIEKQLNQRNPIENSFRVYESCYRIYLSFNHDGDLGIHYIGGFQTTNIGCYG